jgi:FdrA protein
VTLAGIEPPDDPARSRGNVILDLGADEYTVGRPHPMIDLDLLRRRFRQEAADPEVGTILFDLVLGDGAHPDPAGELVPLLTETRERRPELALVAVVVGTEEDPQSRSNQIARLEEAGALVFTDVVAAAAHLARSAPLPALPEFPSVVPLTADGQFTAINVGLERFSDSLRAQGAEALHLDWRPPAGGDDRLQAILDRMKSRPGGES